MDDDAVSETMKQKVWRRGKIVERWPPGQATKMIVQQAEGMNASL